LSILITGVNGFFGKKLANYFLSKNYVVYGIGRNKESKVINVRYWQIDLSANENIDHIVKECQTIYHFAGLTSHNEIVNNTQKARKVNINGTRILLNSFKKFKESKTLVYASSGKVYGHYKSLPLSEDHDTRPLNSLGKLKRDTEKYIEAKLNDKDRFVILRIFNVYGPGQKDNFLIPTIFHQIKNNLKQNKCTIDLGNIDHKRDYIFIDDLVNLFFKMHKLKNLKTGVNIYNVGSGIPIDVNNILKKIAYILNINIKANINPKKLRHDEHDVEYSDIEKISKLTGWKPKVNLESGLKNYISSEFNELIN